MEYSIKDELIENNGGGIINHFSLIQREFYLKQHGIHSQAFTSLQPGLDYFDLPDIGYMAFTKKWGSFIVLSDPVCSPEYFELIILLFNERFPNAVYVQNSASVIKVLNRRLNYYVTQMGSEPRIFLANWQLSGKSKKSIRQAINQVKEQGLEIKEEASLLDLSVVSDAWLKTRACKVEIDFLIRPLSMPYKQGVRYFYAYKNNCLVGFVLFDPIYHNGKIIAYIPNVSRSWNGFQQGLWYAMMAKAIQQFKDEGIEYVDLGLTPLSLSTEAEPQESKRFRKLLQLIYQYGGFLYNFKGLEFAKQRFNGDVSKCYVAHKKALPLWQLLTVFRKCRII